MTLSFLFLVTIFGYIPKSDSTSLFIFAIHGTFTGLNYEFNGIAAEIAKSEIHRRVNAGVYANFSITLEHVSIFCFFGKRRAASMVADIFHSQRRMAAIMGPPCSGNMFSVAEVAAVWDIPVLTGLATSRDLENEAIYSTLTRTTFMIASGYAAAAMDLFRHFQWSLVSFLWDGGNNYWSLLEGAVKEDLEKENIDFNDVPVAKYSDPGVALEQAANIGRSKAFFKASNSCYHSTVCI